MCRRIGKLTCTELDELDVLVSVQRCFRGSESKHCLTFSIFTLSHHQVRQHRWLMAPQQENMFEEKLHHFFYFFVELILPPSHILEETLFFRCAISLMRNTD